MLRHRKLVTGLIVAAFVAFAGTRLLAHFPNITAEIVCDPISGLRVEYTTSSYLQAVGGGNTQVDVYVVNLDKGTGGLVDSQPYEAPDYEFTGSTPLPAGSEVGDLIEIRVVTSGTWDGGVAGGQTRFFYVRVPEGTCTGFGRFTGGGNQVEVGGFARVTRGFTIHCDLLLSNNLEVNWEGNHFHMLEHLTTISCTDSDVIIEDPPPAPLDTLVGVGTGRYNGVDGYTIEFTMVDHGEPGRNDEMAIKIYRTADPTDVVLDVALQKLSGGNLQAHYDQPHGNKK